MGERQAGDLIITASTIITMDPATPRAAHSHPFLSGVVTQPPAYWIAPYVGYPGWDDVAALFRKLQAEQPAGTTLVFNGQDRLLQQVAEPDNTVLDAFFPDRPVAVFDNSGHEVYFNSAAIAFLGWQDGAPPDPGGAGFGRHPDGMSNGMSNGRGYETAAVMAVAAPCWSGPSASCFCGGTNPRPGARPLVPLIPPTVHRQLELADQPVGERLIVEPDQGDRLRALAHVDA
jgi:hypothetical protein